MAIMSGKEGKIRVGSTEVAEVRSFTVAQTAETVQSTTMGNEWHTNRVTFKAWSANVDVLFDPTDAGQNAFDIGSNVAVEFRPGGNSSGEVELSGNAQITGREVDASHDGLVGLKLQLTGDGALTEGTVT